MFWVDYLIISIVLLSAVISIVRGFVREVLSLVAWILAFWVALTFSQHLSVLFDNYITTPSLRIFTAFTILFVITLVLAALINHLIASLVEKTGLTGTDRALGVLFGLVRGVAIVTLLTLLAGTTPMPQDAWWQNSLLLEHVEKIAIWARSFLPSDIAAYVQFS